MKIHHFLLALCLCLCLTACNNNNAVLPEESAQVTGREGLSTNVGLLYTNLVDKDVQDEVKLMMVQAGIKQDYVDEVFSWIDTYNNSVQDLSTFELAPAFTHIDTGYVWYGSGDEYVDVNRHWWKINKFNYYDVLCRSTAFYLLRDFITVSNPVPEEEWHIIDDDNDYSKSWLVTDMDGFKTNPNITLSDNETATFFSLFNPIALPSGTSEQDMYETIKQEWERRGVMFEDSRMFLITIWRQDMELAVASHAAVLIECNDGFMLFEKTNPEYPYQATMFQDLSEVKSYMVDQLNSVFDNGVGTVVVMKNDVLM